MVDSFPGVIYPGQVPPAATLEAGTGFQVHPSSPPIAWSTSATAQTTSFTPPGGALLVVCAGARQLDSQQTATFTPSSTGVTGLAWSTVVTRDNLENGVTNSAAAAILVAALPGTAAAMTVSVNVTGSLNTSWVAVYVVTAADVGVAAVGAIAEGGVSTADPLNGSLTATRTGSLLFVAASEWQASGAPTSTTLTAQSFDNGTSLSAVAGYRTMASPPTATTWDLDSPGSPVAWTWVAAEIKAAPLGAASANTIRTVNRARFRAATW